MRVLLCSFAVLLSMLLPAAVGAQDTAAPAAVSVVEESAIDQHVRQIAKQLRCLVCQGESVADSHAELAQDMRRKIHEKLRQGWGDEQIFDYFVARYGDFVLYRPPVKAATWLLWFGPLLMLVVGLILLFGYVRRRSRQIDTGSLSAQEAERARALLDSVEEPPQ